MNMPNQGQPNACNTAMKPSATRRLQLKGRLQRMSDIPLDILLEIFSHLDPRDLLHLCRTSKSLRAVLLDRSALFVWKSARRNLENLPAILDDLSEPRYASLLFDKHCQLCLAPAKTNYVQWSARIRCCDDCLKNIDIFTPTIPQELIKVKNIIPSYFSGADSRDHYHVPSMITLMQEVKTLSDEGNNFEDWYEDKRASLNAIEQLGEQCETWLAVRSWAHKVELGRIRQKRVDDVIAKLKDLGWEYLINRISRKKIASHKLVAYSRPLTDRSWCSMEPAMVDFMEELQQRNKKGVMIMKSTDTAGKYLGYESWTLDGEKNMFGPFDPDTGKLSDEEPLW
ncbi:uncharacterized protein EV420DRAFT_1559501 [Desarmillaria tabescens]|uniref:F-box domain-containing protein n=1 Tax=Armillaria tabescens TaxID=1929756 RepID=A0AA39JZW4_ARMTA|nr:uncharacterized protein EV420DRAFT_1559501 [Desarmillaria tabescens]KAK0451975.1 hypothetical protein EV420DRAFT_1559501 [Desarmillaria tabescens]